MVRMDVADDADDAGVADSRRSSRLPRVIGREPPAGRQRYADPGSSDEEGYCPKKCERAGQTYGRSRDDPDASRESGEEGRLRKVVGVNQARREGCGRLWA